MLLEQRGADAKGDHRRSVVPYGVRNHTCKFCGRCSSAWSLSHSFMVVSGTKFISKSIFFLLQTFLFCVRPFWSLIFAVTSELCTRTALSLSWEGVRWGNLSIYLFTCSLVISNTNGKHLTEILVSREGLFIWVYQRKRTVYWKIPSKKRNKISLNRTLRNSSSIFEQEKQYSEYVSRASQ